MDANEMVVFSAFFDYAAKYQTAYIPLQGYYQYLYEYGLKNNVNALKVQDNVMALLKKVYAALAKKNYAAPDMKNQSITGIFLQNPSSLSHEQVQALLAKIKRYYDSLDKDIGRPFVESDQLPLKSLPAGLLKTISAQDLVAARLQDVSISGKIVRIELPSGQEPIIPSENLGDLYRMALNKLRKALELSNDLAGFIVVKLKKQFPNQAGINTFQDTFRLAESTPSFMAALTSEVMDNTQSNAKEKAIHQCAEIVKHFAIMQGEQQQRRTHTDKTNEILLQILEKYPTPFTRSQILKLREKHNFLKLHTEHDYIEIVNRFLQAATAPGSNGLPLLVTIKTAGDTQYIHRRYVFKSFKERLESLSFEAKKSLVEPYEQKIKKNVKDDPVLSSEGEFADYLVEFCRQRDEAFVQLLLQPELLFRLMTEASGKMPEIQMLLPRFFHLASSNQIPSLRSIQDILGLSREEIVRNIHAMYPAAAGESIFTRILKFLFGFGKSMGNTMERAIEHQMEDKKKLQAETEATLKQARKAKAVENKAKAVPAKTEASSKEQKKAVIIQRMEDLIQQLCGEEDIPQALKRYEEKWNHTINPAARQSNVRLVAERVQARLKFFNNPTAEIIKKETTDLLKTEESLRAVRDRESLRNYIALVMAKAIVDHISK